MLHIRPNIRVFLVSFFALFLTVSCLSAELQPSQTIGHAAAQKQISLLFLILIAVGIVIFDFNFNLLFKAKNSLSFASLKKPA